MKPTPIRTLMAAALCAAAMLTPGAASAGAWAYDSTAKTITHNETPWGLNVTASGSQLIIDSVADRVDSPCALPLGDPVSGGYSITAIADKPASLSGVFFGRTTSGPGHYIQSLTLPVTLKTIGNYAFPYCSGLTGALTIPDSVTSIGDFAFADCRGLTNALTIGNSVTNIGGSAFSGCRGLTSVTIPDSVTSIGDSAFFDCRGLAGALTIGNSVTSIGTSAFSGCRGLTGALTIPDSVTSIGTAAFSKCSGLTGALTIGNNVNQHRQ